MDVRRVLCVALVSMAGLAGCAGTPDTAAPPAPKAAQAAAPGPVLSITDPWVKTIKGGGGMSAAFGTLVNSGDTAVTVLKAATPAAPRVELHETVQEAGKMVMRPKEDGFTIPAKGTLTLEPGGNHIMLMDVKNPVKPGSEVRFTLTLKDGSVMEFTAVGKDFAGANEEYQPGHQ